MLLIGAGIGALASQLGAVTVSSAARRPEPRGRRHPEHRDEPRCFAGHRAHRVDPHGRAGQLGGHRACSQPGHPGLGQVDTRRSSSKPACRSCRIPPCRRPSTPPGVPPATADEVVAINAQARLDGLRIALSGVVIFGIIGLFFTGRIPQVQPGHADPEAEPDAEAADDPTPRPERCRRLPRSRRCGDAPEPGTSGRGPWADRHAARWGPMGCGGGPGAGGHPRRGGPDCATLRGAGGVLDVDVVPVPSS